MARQNPLLPKGQRSSFNPRRVCSGQVTVVGQVSVSVKQGVGGSVGHARERVFGVRSRDQGVVCKMIGVF